MFKKLFGWLTGEETVEEILETPPTCKKDCVCESSNVAESIKATVNSQITDAVTQSKPKKNRRRKPKAKRPITEGSTKGGNGAVKQPK